MPRFAHSFITSISRRLEGDCDILSIPVSSTESFLGGGGAVCTVLADRWPQCLDRWPHSVFSCHGRAKLFILRHRSIGEKNQENRSDGGDAPRRRRAIWPVKRALCARRQPTSAPECLVFDLIRRGLGAAPSSTDGQLRDHASSFEPY